MAGGDDLEVTNILDPDLEGTDLGVTENDIDLHLDDALSDASQTDGPDDDLDFLDLDDFVLDDDGAAVDTEPQAAADMDMDIDFELDDEILVADPAIAGTGHSGANTGREAMAAGEHRGAFASGTGSFDPEATVMMSGDFERGENLMDDLDIDFELDDAVEPAQSGDSRAAEDDDFDFVLDEPAGGESRDLKTSGQEADAGIDLELDETMILEPSPLDSEDIEFELDDVLEERPDSDKGGDFGFGLESETSGSIDDDDSLTETASEDLLSLDGFGLEDPAGAAGAEPDFDLDRILADSDESEDFPAEDAFISDETEEAADFDLEELVEDVPEPESPADDDDEAILAAYDESGLTPEIRETVGFVAGTGLAPDGKSPEQAVTPGAEPASAMDQERIERLVETTVRETVSRVLERLLPGLIEDIVTREIEKLTREMDAE